MNQPLHLNQTDKVENSFRFCPRCGTKSSGHGHIPFRCSSCAYANFFGPVAAVGGLIVNATGQLLMVRRARNPGQGKWGLPGGFVDRSESIEAALKREIHEETQLELVSAKYLMSLPNIYNYQGVVSPVIDLFYICTVANPDQLKLAADELDYFEWTIPTQRHLENMAFVSNRLAIEHWSQNR